MKSKWFGALLALSVATSLWAQQTQPAAEWKSEQDKVSYSIGVTFGISLKRQGVEANPEMLLKGIQDAMADKSLLTEEEIKAILTKYQEERVSAASDRNKKEGEAFLASNKTKEGVVALPSGLQYKILTAGTGPKPKATDTVVTHYRGTLLNGKEFDSSYSRNQPASFPVNGVIAGWTEALQLMPVGSKWQLFIPASLAYGDRGAGGVIEPNATLIFEVELLEIKAPEAEAADDMEDEEEEAGEEQPEKE